LTALCLVLPLAAQQTPTFRTAIDIARVTVRVLDKNRTPVRDLTEKDFTVLVDGKPKPVVAFAAEDVAGPITPTAPWMRDVAPDVAANTIARPRLVVLLLDDALTPDLFTLKTAKEIARRAIDELGPNDMASVVFTRDNRQPQDFTSDRSRLLAAVDRMDLGCNPRIPAEWRYCMVRSAKVMRAAVEFLRGVPDLKSMVLYITVGPNLEMTGPKAAGLGSTDTEDNEADLSFSKQFSDVVGAAHAAGVPVYGISTMGLVPPTPRYGGYFSNPTALGIRAEEARNMSHQLRHISDVTGGHAIIFDNAPARLVPRVFVENSLHYTLGYQADGPMADGRYRRIEVRVNRKDVIVEPGGERTFYSPKVPAGVSLVSTTTAALAGLVPLADEPLRLAVASFADPETAAARTVLSSVALALGVDVVGSPAGDEIEMELRVFDGEGRRQLDVKKQAWAIRPSPRDRGFDFLTTLSLEPGRYNLRLSTRSAERDKSGSVYTDITIPDYANAPISMSDAIVTSAFVRRTPTPLNAFDGFLTMPPTTARTFDRADRASAFLRVYWGRNKPGATVTMTATITDTDNRQVFTRTTPLTPDATTGLRSADYQLDLPLNELSTGEYVLTLSAKPAIGGEIQRNIRFTVR
jgi:VWFA-related protein